MRLQRLEYGAPLPITQWRGASANHRARRLNGSERTAST